VNVLSEEKKKEKENEEIDSVAFLKGNISPCSFCNQSCNKPKKEEDSEELESRPDDRGTPLFAGPA